MKANIVLSPYKEDKPISFSSFSSSVKLALMAVLALLGCFNLRASSGVISRRKSWQKRGESAEANAHSSRISVDDDDTDESSQIVQQDEEMRRLIQERNQAGAKRGKVAWLMRCVLLTSFHAT